MRRQSPSPARAGPPLDSEERACYGAVTVFSLVLIVRDGQISTRHGTAPAWLVAHPNAPSDFSTAVRVKHLGVSASASRRAVEDQTVKAAERTDLDSEIPARQGVSRRAVLRLAGAGAVAAPALLGGHAGAVAAPS